MARKRGCLASLRKNQLQKPSALDQVDLMPVLVILGTYKDAARGGFSKFWEH